MAKHYITGLDIGSNNIKAVTAQVKPSGEAQILSCIKEPSKGVKKGVVINIDETAETITNCIEKTEEEIGRNINKVFININGSHIFSIPSQGLVSVSRADQKISSVDVDRVMRAAETVSLPPNKEILEAFPKEYIVDGIKGIKEPIGMQGLKLEAQVTAVGCLSPFLNSLNQAVLNSGLHMVDDSVITPYASALSTLNPREKELGVVLVDIGASTTGVAVFEDDNLIHLTIFPFGSANITNDIAIFFRTDVDIAERMKTEFGSCVRNGPDKKEKMKDDSLSEPLIFSRKSLIEIIEARVSEIFTEVNKELKKISRQGLLPSGVVLTGGGSLLPKIVDFTKKELKLPCRIGYPSKGPEEFLSKIEDPAMSVACGLVLHGISDKTPSDIGLLNKVKRIFRVFIP